MTDDLISRLRQTRASMLGTDDERHYFDCHEAADALEVLEQIIAELEQKNTELKETINDISEVAGA
jgi:hypothetical protein